MSNKLHLTAFRRSLITLTFISGVFISHTAIAQIRSDPSASGNQRPTVLLAPNGVPLVNIQTPSAAGVSRNTYSQFDVQPNGAILNNSRTDTATQLGGWVQAKPLKNTMFPKDWDATKIQTEIESAWAVRDISVSEPKKWRGISSSGVVIEGYLQPKITAYPQRN